MCELAVTRKVVDVEMAKRNGSRNVHTKERGPIEGHAVHGGAVGQLSCSRQREARCCEQSCSQARASALARFGGLSA